MNRQQTRDEAHRLALQAIMDLEHVYFLLCSLVDSGEGGQQISDAAARASLKDALEWPLRRFEFNIGAKRHGREDESTQRTEGEGRPLHRS